MPPFRALSLDLWFTTIYFERSDELAWRAARVEALDEFLRDRSDGRFGTPTVARALDEARDDFQQQGRDSDVVAPGAFVDAVTERLSAVVPQGRDRAVDAYAAAGLRARPPRLAEGVLEVARAFEQRGIPLIAITNTARPEATWQAMFDRLGGPRFRHIVTSCEVGCKKPDTAIFRAAADRLGVRLPEILHVGDRWELDVAGARASGAAPVVYRGLWARYAAAGYTEGTLPSHEGPGRPGDATVPRIDRLEELLDTDRFEFARA